MNQTGPKPPPSFFTRPNTNGNTTVNGNTTFNGNTALNGTTTVDDRINVAGDAGQIRFTGNEFDRDGDVGEFSDYKLLLYPGNQASNSYGFGI